MLIKVTRSSMPYYEEFCEEIKDLWESHWLTNSGIKYQLLKSKLEDYLGTKNIALCVNGHLALENIIAAMNFPKGAEVITTPFTFISTTHAITRNNLVPVFCDINRQDFTIDVKKIESLITPKTVAILPVHVYGSVCDVYEIKKIADKYNLKVIYDAAHAFGVEKDGMGIANFGDATMFSFHATKVFNSIEGGAVAIKEPTKIKIFNDLINFGISGLDEISYIGANAKMNEFQAAMGICNLRHIDSEISKRKKVVLRYIERLSNVDAPGINSKMDEVRAAYGIINLGHVDAAIEARRQTSLKYREALAGVEGVSMMEELAGVKHNYSYFPVIFDSYKYSRDEVLLRLKENDILARKYFYPLTNSVECYKNHHTAGTEKNIDGNY